MHVFVTGATGWVGSAVVKELISAGHRVTGLARSGDKARQLSASGATVVQGTLEELATLRSVASGVDAIIHTAFNHDFARFIESCEQDRQVIEAMGSVLEGSSRPLLVTSGLLGVPRGGSEQDGASPNSPRKSEPAARALAARGIRAATIRLAPSVHGIGDWGFVPMLIGIAREKGVSAFIGDGTNAWAAVHRDDAARVYRLALEQGATEPVYHAVAEEVVPFRTIAEAIGRGLGVPVESREREHFGWFAHFASTDMSASAQRTRELLGWKPEGPTLLSELSGPEYFASRNAAS
jgi:nucleoside-diphosphate-sugar epimerase